MPDLPPELKSLVHEVNGTHISSDDWKFAVCNVIRALADEVADLRERATIAAARSIGEGDGRRSHSYIDGELTEGPRWEVIDGGVLGGWNLRDKITGAQPVINWPNRSELESWAAGYNEDEERYLAAVASESDPKTVPRIWNRMAESKRIVLCGSSRFPDAFHLANAHLSMQGHVVISLGLFGHADEPRGAQFLTSDGDESTPEKQGLDELHFRKIDLADEVCVVNLGGYIGSSTRREIEYAESQGKPVWMLFPQRAANQEDEEA